MPCGLRMIPGLRVGLLPVLQMVLLTPLVLSWASPPASKKTV
jgi:hypothetical protein